MGGSCPVGCRQWSASFGDCLCNGTDLTGFAFGLASIVCMAVCFLPQLWRNWRSHSSEGLALGLVCIWQLGDVANIVGVFLSKALPTQTYMAVLYAAIDMALNLQHCWYNYWKAPLVRRVQSFRRRRKPRPGASSACPDPGTVMHNPLQALGSSVDAYEGLQAPSACGKQPATRLPSLSAGLLIVAHGAATAGLPLLATALSDGHGLLLPGASGRFLAADDQALARNGVGRVLTAVAGTGGADSSSTRVKVGTALGWVMTAAYLSARLPQLIKNWQRRSAEGLSVAMLILLLMGNAAYLLSIFIRSVAWPFLSPKMPWIVEAGASLFLDGAIMTQAIVYSRRQRLARRTPGPEQALTAAA